MAEEAPVFTLPAGIHVGQMRGRQDRPAKNARWYLAKGAAQGAPAMVAKVGWGDLSFVDLDDLAGHVGSDEILLVLPENPPGGQHLPFHAPSKAGGPEPWCWYDRPDDPPGPAAADLVDAAWYAIVDNTVLVVDRFAEANRSGAIWRQRGRRYSRTGKMLSTGRVRLKAISPERLLRRVEHLVHDPTLRVIDLPARPAPS